MARLIIRGGRALSGVIRPRGNKNAALPMLAASLLTDETVTLENVPDIADVRAMLDLLSSLGVDIARAGSRVALRARPVRRRRLDPALCRRIRASILLAGPLAARHGRAELYQPGGDLIGRRRLDTHFASLGALGIESETRPGRFVFRRRKLRGADLLLDEASVTATENLLMAAALAEGRTTIFNAACEPHVQDLGRLLQRMGARIEGLGTNRLVIDGVPRLGGATLHVSPDYIEAGSFLVAAAATGGELTLEDAPDDTTLQIMARGFGKLGLTWSRTPAGALFLPAGSRRRVAREWNGATPKIEDGPWPAFPSDLMSLAILLATQSRGTALFFEKMFESRMYFVDRLIEMGAQIVACDPHRVLVTGPSRLHGGMVTSPDIRAGMTLLLAALCARGVSVIEQAQMIDRGYERIDLRLRELGADIEREEP